MKTEATPILTAGIIAIALASAGPLCQPAFAAPAEAIAPANFGAGQLRAPPAAALPFSIQDFIAFMSETFHTLPIESGPDRARFIYSERQSGGRDVESCGL